MFRLLSALLVLPLSLVAAEGPVVVASFTIPADIARSVAAGAASVTSVTPPNGDVHELQPTPAQIRALAKADLVVALNPGFETWIADLEKAGALKRPVLYLAPELEIEEHEAHGHVHNHEHKGVDPHVWMDPDVAARMGAAIAKRLAEETPADAAKLKAASDAFAKRMTALAEDVRTTLERVPPERRRIVCYHDNLSRFAQRFGYTVSGTLLDAASTEAADPSAKRMSALLKKIREEKVPAIFADNTVSRDLPAAIAREAGLPPPVTLYVDALDSPGTPAGTYEGMLREDARRIAEALSR